MELALVLFFHGIPLKILHGTPCPNTPSNYMDIHLLILHGIPWKIFHGTPLNSMEVFYTGLVTRVLNGEKMQILNF